MPHTATSTTPGDPLGTVIAWLWRTDPHEATLRISEYLNFLRRHPNAPTPPLTLDDVLHALHLALPGDFTNHDYTDLCTQARSQVPSYLGE